MSLAGSAAKTAALVMAGFAAEKLIAGAVSGAVGGLAGAAALGSSGRRAVREAIGYRRGPGA